MNIRTQKGFTIYELLIAMLIVGIIMTIGVPNLRDFTRNSRISSVANDFHASFLVARSEAPRAKRNVTICASESSMDAEPDCDTNDWEKGWIIFVDVDGDIEVDDPADEPILRRHPALDESIELEVNDDAEFFSFGPNGMGRGDVGGDDSMRTLVICDERGNEEAPGGWSAARYIFITPIGRSTIIRDVEQIENAGGCP